MNKTPKITEKDLGNFVIDKSGNLWRIISWTDRPTFTIESVMSPEIRQSWVVGAPITEQYTKLIKEQNE